MVGSPHIRGLGVFLEEKDWKTKDFGKSGKDDYQQICGEKASKLQKTKQTDEGQESARV